MVWKWLFRKEKALLGLSMRGHLLDIQHVDSTAIPGIIAKPIIDLLAAVSDFERAFECVRRIERLGYEYRGENPELRHYHFVKGDPVRREMVEDARVRGRVYPELRIKRKSASDRFVGGFLVVLGLGSMAWLTLNLVSIWWLPLLGLPFILLGLHFVGLEPREWLFALLYRRAWKGQRVSVCVRHARLPCVVR
jgi:hypothetical protein